MDKAAIFHALTERNALRKAALLPLLDLHQEFAREVRRIEIAEYYDLRMARFGDEHDRLLASVLDGYHTQFGHGPQNWLDWLGVRHQTEARFRAFLEQRGLVRPDDFDAPPGIYGIDKTV